VVHLNPILDKKGFWLDVVDDLADQLDAGFYFMLRNNAYLDRIERGEATVAVGSESLKRLCERKYARAIARALSEAMDQVIAVSFVHGPARIIEKPRNDAAIRDYKQQDADDMELAMLHDQYGDIMSIVDNHPLFRKASLPLTAEGWGIFPQILTNACKDYGVLNVLTALRSIASRTNIRNPRGYFLRGLERGDYGGKLAKSANNVGKDFC
jgi:hypothetical protein